MSRSSTDENKFLYDFLFEQKEQIETNFGEPLEWMRLNDKKSSRIQFTLKADGFNRDHWDKWINWHLEHMTKLEQALKGSLQQASEALKNYDLG